MLEVRKNQIVDSSGKAVRLRGTCIGGWMNMENFINGYPGAEHGVRAALAGVLGPDKAAFFFDRWLDYFLTEADIAFIRQCGANVVRLALNYRHFERDDEPFRYVESGFVRLERALEWCARHDLYVILDLHAVQGWQSTDWHCDNASGHSVFWEHPHFQDRFVALWEEFARRYKGNATIAGYDVMNEPLSHTLSQPHWDAINRVYRRVVGAIRAIDPDHIIFLEGDVFGSRGDGLEAPFADNLAYEGHSYSPTGFGPGPYPGTINGKYWDRKEMGQSFLRHQMAKYTQKHNLPLWMGEFGAAYNGPEEEKLYRLCAMDDQIDAFEEYGAHWTSWTYKDIGSMGWVVVDRESEYMQRVEPVLTAKRTIGTDAWMTWLPRTPAQQQVVDLAHLIQGAVSDRDLDTRTNEQLLLRATLAGYAANVMGRSWARCFEGLSEQEIDRILQSFAFENCQPHRALVDIVSKHMRRPV
jgi:endoglucanase